MTYLNPRRATVVLYQGDDLDEMALLKRRLDHARAEAEQTDARRFGDDLDSVADAQRAFDEFVDTAAERAVELVLHSIGKRRFRDLLAAHPPRRVPSEPDEDGKTVEVDHPEDDGWGVNMETFPDALLCYRQDGAATIAHPEFDSEEAVRDFVEDEFADGDYDDAFRKAYFLNRSGRTDPKALESAGPDLMSAFRNFLET